jgi:drug/metabolite transporter (DMT)-like permease
MTPPANRRLRGRDYVLCLCVGIVVLLLSTRGHFSQGTINLALGVCAVIGAAALYLRPSVAGPLWGSSAVGTLLMGVGLGCVGIHSLHVAPQRISDVIGWIGVALFAASMVVRRLRR